MSPSTADADPGTRLAEELRLLVDAVADRAGPWLDRLTTSTHGEHEPDTGAPQTCGWCPLCAVLAMLRGQPTDLAALVLDRVAELVALLRAVLADRWEPGVLHMPGFRPPDPGAAPQQPPSPRRPARPAPVQKIPVRRTDRPDPC